MRIEPTKNTVSLEHFNSSTLEKVTRMIEVLEFIYRHPKQKSYLVLKGGTALHLIHFPLKRLSVDIDLDFHSPMDKSEIMLIRQRIRDNLDQFLISKGYQKNSRSRFSYGLDALIYQYTNEKGNKDYIKIEINYLHRVHVMKPVWAKVIRNPIWPEFEVQTLHPIELFATKIVALMNRLAARDFYDVFQILENHKFSDEDGSHLKSIVLFYVSITSKNYDKSLSPDMLQHLTYHQMKLTLLPMLSKEDNFNLEQAKKIIDPFIRDVFDLTKDEQAYFDSLKEGRFQPEMLFQSSQIQRDISAHPMVLWILKHRPID